jgi:hypothetical protein
MISKQQFKKLEIGDRVVWGTLPDTKKDYGTVITKVGYSHRLITGPATAKALSGSSAHEPSSRHQSSHPDRLPSQGKAATRNEALPLKPGGAIPNAGAHQPG